MAFNPNRDNEQRVLSYFMHHPTKISELVPLQDLFLIVQSQQICAGLIHLLDKGIENIDIDTIHNGIIETGAELERSHLVTIFDTFTDFLNIDFYIESLKTDKSRSLVTNELMEQLYESVNLRDTGNLDKIESSVDNIKDEIVRIRGLDDKILHAGSLRDSFQAEIAKVEEMGATQFYDMGLDTIIADPASPTEMTTIYGQKGSGKSTFALNIAVRLIANGVPVLYITPEDSSTLITSKIISQRTNVPYIDIKRNQYGNERDKNRVQKEIMAIEKWDNLYIVDEPSLWLRDVDILIRTVQERTGQDYMVVVIDLLTMIRDFSNTNASEFEDAMNKLHGIIKARQVHAINVVQENENRFRQGRVKLKELKFYHPTLSDVKNGAVIAERSRVMLNVWNLKYMIEAFISDKDDSVELTDEDLQPIISIKNVKQNRGDLGGKARYWLDGACARMKYMTS
jgi:replicative DNA helicase